jgi:hypothetical protein
LVAGRPIREGSTDKVANEPGFWSPDGHDDGFFDQIRCSGKYYSDIYEIPGAETP